MHDAARFLSLLGASLLGAYCTLTVGYLLTVLVAASIRRPPVKKSATATKSLVIVVPAHNEVLVVARTVQALQAQDYPAERFQVVVIADNCTDSTATVAREAGALVWERQHETKRGKGQALDWAFTRLLCDDEQILPWDAVVVVDADTWVDPHFLRHIAERLPEDTTMCALQGRYGVAYPQESWRSALTYAGFALINHVRPLGRARMGCGIGLKGNGFALSRSVIKTIAWRSFGITEDIEYGLELLMKQGIKVEYVPAAVVISEMPTVAGQAKSQRIRWEKGRYALMRERVAPLFGLAISRRDGRLLDAALDLMTLPLGEMGALIVFWGALLLLATAPVGMLLWCGLCGAGYLVYVLMGLRVAGAQKAAYTALIFAPFYVAWKVGTYFVDRLLTRRSPIDGEWIRTERSNTVTPDKSESATLKDEQS